MMASKGLYFTDSQLEDIWQRNQQQQSGVGSSSLDQRIRDRQEKRGDRVEDMFPQERRQAPGTWPDSILDFIGGSLW